MRKPQAQENHDRMIKVTANYLMGNKFRNVKADIPGFHSPSKLTWISTGEGYTPDITAIGQQLNLFEVETPDSLNEPHTEDQWKLFAQYAQETQAEFWIVVPKGSILSAENRLLELGIRGNVWEV